MDVYIEVPSTDHFRPSHQQGDMEFWGNGPRVNVWAEVYPLGSKIYLRYSARFQENGGDNSLFEGSHSVEIYDIARHYPGKNILSIVTPRYAQMEFTDVDVKVNEVYHGATTLINRVHFQGDTYGGWFGGNDDPWVQFVFNPVIVRITD